MATTTEEFPRIAIKSKIAKPASKTSFKVAAATLDDLRKALAKRKHWGEYTANANVGYKFKGKMIVELSLSAKPEIAMPVWQGYSKASKDDKAAWDAMYAKLLKHENNHHALSLEVYAKFFMEIDSKNAEIDKINKALAKETDEKKKDSILKGFKPMTVDVMKARLSQFSTDLQAAQDTYDKSTDHGKKEGVKI